MALSKIEPVVFRLVAERLNQLCYARVKCLGPRYYGTCVARRYSAQGQGVVPQSKSIPWRIISCAI
jgi:hypothetical protein